MMMKLSEFKEILGTYGAQTQSWPVTRRAAAEALLVARNSDGDAARALLAEAEDFDAFLKSWDAPVPESANLAERIVATATAHPQDGVRGAVRASVGAKGRGMIAALEDMLGIGLKPAWVLTPAGGLMASALFGLWLGMAQQPGMSDMLLDPAYYDEAAVFTTYDDVLTDEDVL